MYCILHPHKGYLNTLFTLFQTGKDSARYEIYREHDAIPLETIVLTPNVPYNIKIKEPGHYKLCRENEFIQDFLVLNGYKFGGSKYKNSYISEKTPWIMVVMNDRTYFHNRETGQEYMESLSPDVVEFVSSSFVLFSYEQQNFQTLYSLEDGSPVIVVHNLVFVNEEVLIWKEINDAKEEICIVHLSDTSVIRRIKCNDFLIADDIQKLFCYVDKSIHVISLHNITDEQTLLIEDEFITFLDSNYYVSKKSLDLSITSLHDKSVRKIPLRGTLAKINRKELISVR